MDPQVRLTDYFSVAARGFASEIISRKIVEHFAGQIDIPFKLVLPKHLNLAIDRNLEVPVDNNRAKLQFKIKLDGDDVQTPITFPVPIETKQGLWLLASLSSAGIDSPAIPERCRRASMRFKRKKKPCSMRYCRN